MFQITRTPRRVWEVPKDLTRGSLQEFRIGRVEQVFSTASGDNLVTH